jgi:hypothetical protein
LALIDSAEFSLHYTEAILLPLNVVIAPSLGKNIFLGRAQFFLGYREKAKINGYGIYLTRAVRFDLP